MLAKRHGIFCLVDGAQVVGQIDVNVKSLGRRSGVLGA